MANNSLLFSPKYAPLAFTNPSKQLKFCHSSLVFTSHPLKHKKDLSMLASASSSFPPINVDYLESEFSGHGVSFAEIGESCVVRMRTENGSLSTLMLPSGLITSYKARMWHGGTVELLHTNVADGDDGSAVIQGGVSLGLMLASEDGNKWSPRTWVLHDVKGSPQDCIQVELMSSDSEKTVEIKYTLTLHPDNLTSEIAVTNSTSSSIQLVGSFMSHLTVSSPDATYAIGLEGSNYLNKPPLETKFSIIPPDFKDKPTGQGQSWVKAVFPGLLPNWGSNGNVEAGDGKSGLVKTDEEIEFEEEDNYAQMTDKMSRIYTYAPRRFSFNDKGRRNSVGVGRDGFDEMYIFSPGSAYDLYGKYSFVCTGPSAMLKPISIGPEDVWRGGQFIYNPNL
ncbi:hypothetical protein MKW94_029489 [Papaver nudicaule]|uniref:NDH-dependent cyclic electron flow 5 n=1 Tax=Papaver nudicaule TaxID=74823 RepID=A0AA41V0F8_PAPNU|nr:hypothetical protein [Papaver nudicaule]